MRIIAETTEAERLVTHCPVQTQAIEELTGADMIVTPSKLPFLPVTLQKHIEAGALFVQLKYGSDLAASIPTARLKSQIARLNEIAPGYRHLLQKHILFIGNAGPNPDGNLLIDNHVTYLDAGRYMPYEMFLSNWFKCLARGVMFSFIPSVHWLDTWINAVTRTNEQVKQRPEYELYPDKINKTEFLTDPLQSIRTVPDALVVLAALPGIGPKIVQTLVDQYGTNYLSMLEELTNPHLQSPLAGIGKGKISNVRQTLNLKPWESLGRVIHWDLMQEYGGYDEHRCEACPHRGSATMFPTPDGKMRVYCDNWDCGEPKGMEL